MEIQMAIKSKKKSFYIKIKESAPYKFGEVLDIRVNISKTFSEINHYIHKKPSFQDESVAKHILSSEIWWYFYKINHLKFMWYYYRDELFEYPGILTLVFIE